MFQSLGSPNSLNAETEHLNSSRPMMMACGQLGLGKKCSYGSKCSIISNVFKREVHGTLVHRLKNPFGDSGTPERLKMKIDDIIPTPALEAGNIFMGFTNCGRYLLSYTCRPTEQFGAGVFDSDASYMYTLHIWLFTPYKSVRKVSQVSLFDNNGVYDNNLLMEISQWDLDDSHLLITGHSANPDSECHHTFYTTITTIPDAKNCPNCVYMHDDEMDDYVMNNARMRTNCILHGLTLHIKYDHVSPYPKLNADVQLRFKNSVLLNTGNVIHLVGFNLIRPTPAKMETMVVPLAASSAVSTTKVPLRCDMWLKLSNANMGALSSLKLGNFEHNSNVEGNVISLNALDCLLSIFPNTVSIKVQHVNHQIQNASTNEGPTTAHRRLSQSSTDSEFSVFSPKHISTCDWGPPMSPPFLNKPRSPRQGEATGCSKNISPSKLMLPPQERKFFKRRLSSQSMLANTSSTCAPETSNVPTEQTVAKNIDNEDQNSSTQQSKSAFDVFEMRIEDTAVERHLSSFKTFRKRRLADKKYEFKDADISGENIIPLKMTRRKTRSQHSGNSMHNLRCSRNENENTGNESPRGSYPYSDISHPRSPRAYSMSPVMSPNYNNESDVLRPLNNNPKVKVSALSPNNNMSTVGIDGNEVKVKEDDFGKEFKEYASQILTQEHKVNDIPSHPHAKPTISFNINCVAKVLRSYIQKEDDNMSVITDIEDELCQGYPFPVALPLEVHGAGYQQLQMISNSKAEKFQVPVVQVLQRTLDIEMLCNEVANVICIASNKHYCSCMDFDLAFADANPDRGTVTAVVVMLVQAMSQKHKIRGEKSGILYNQDPRKKYETFFVCEWIPDQEHCRILYKSNLRELETVPELWHPTENMEAAIKTHNSYSSTKKTLTNTLAVHDWQSLDELVDAYGIVTLFKDDGLKEKTDRRLNDFNGLMYGNDVDFASVPSTATDSEDEWAM